MAMIRCLIPDLPSAAELLPWLQRIDAQRWYTNNGPLVGEFERRLRTFVAGAGEAECVTLSSGMSALELGLRVLGVGAGQRVLLPALTFPATALAVMRCGAQPVFADVCPQRWTLSAAIARQAMKSARVDAIVPVATYGQPLAVQEWDELARDSGLPVLIDAAAALGAQAVGRRVHLVFSLHATKPMGVGEGGLFVSTDRELAGAVRRLANFGFADSVSQTADGTNAKLSEYAAAVALAQLERWPLLLERRRRVYGDYVRVLEPIAGVRRQAATELPPAVLCVRLPRPAAPVAAALKEAGVETRRWYLPPLTGHPAFRDAQRIGPGGSSALPVTEALAETLLGLPFHTRLATEEVRAVADRLAAALDRAAVAPLAPAAGSGATPSS